MKILDLKVMRGPNIWSNYRQKLIVMRLDLEELEKSPTHRIEGFAGRIEKLMPSLYGHRCSEADKGGFFQRVAQGTWMGHVIEHIALELQTLAGMDCGYGRTRSTDQEGVYNVVFAYRVEEAGLYAANAAVNVAEALVKGVDCDISRDIGALRDIEARRRLPGNTNVIIEEAHRAEIPYHLVNDSLFILGYGINQVKMRDTLAGTSSSIGLEIADHRYDTKNLLQKAEVQVPAGWEITEAEELQVAFEELGTPLIIKPLRGYHRRRTSLPLRDQKEALPFLQQALYTYNEAVIERYIYGDLFRVLLIDFKVIAVTRYQRHRLEADGSSALSQLIARHHAGADAGHGIDPYLVLHDHQEIYIDGEPEEYVGDVLPATRVCIERIARLCDLNMCCVDIIAKDLACPLGPDQGSVIAVEARPGLTDFLRPVKGNGRNVITPMFSMLFDKKNGARIPLVAVRGNGESRMISLLIAHICDRAGKKTGVAGKSGIQICGHLLSSEACRGHESVRGVLFDPGIDTAVVECPTEQILESGLAFDTSEISIITGSRQAETKKNKQLAEQEKQADLAVGRTTPSYGHLILNADNECHYLAEDLYGEIVLYAASADHPLLKKHCGRGRVAAYIEEEQLVLQKGKWKIPLLPLARMDFGPQAIQAALPAVLAAWLLKIDTPQICSALASFRPAEALKAH